MRYALALLVFAVLAATTASAEWDPVSLYGGANGVIYDVFPDSTVPPENGPWPLPPEWMPGYIPAPGHQQGDGLQKIFVFEYALPYSDIEEAYGGVIYPDGGGTVTMVWSFDYIGYFGFVPDGHDVYAFVVTMTTSGGESYVSTGTVVSR